MKSPQIQLVAAALLALLAPPAGAEPFHAEWSQIGPAIERNIEQNRKRDAVIEVVDAQGTPIPGAKIAARQQTHEFLFGCNLFALGMLDTPELNAKYAAAFARVFNFATLPFYWRDLEPVQGQPRFAAGSPPIWRRPPPDVLVAWCRAHGVTPKGHALMYSKTMFMPDWTPRSDPPAFLSLARKHIAEIAARYGRDIPVWDVVNEEIPRLRNPSQWHAVPDDYLAWCFTEAGRLLPREARLLINDGTQEAHFTTAEYEKLIQGLLARQVRLEGVGIQFHSGPAAYPPGPLRAAYERLGRLGLPLWITEITIPGTGADGPARQAAVVANLYRLWFSTPGMAGATWWNLADGTAFGNENAALGGLLDKQMNPKPAFESLDRLINRDWKTNVALTTGPDGKARLRGFRGKYRVTIAARGVSRELEVDLSQRAPALHRLTLTP